MRNRQESIDRRAAILSEGELQTLKDLYYAAEKYHKGKTAFQEVVKNEVISYTYDRYTFEVKAFGTRLMDMGLEGQHIALIGENSYHWILAHLAVVCMGVSVPLDKELSFDDKVRLVKKGDVTAIICSAKYTAEARKIKEEIPSVKVLITDSEAPQEGEYALNELIREGEELVQNGDRSWIDRKVEPGDLAAIQFTSGTTGANKGVQMLHSNIAANVNSICKMFPVEPVTFSVLPLNHTFESNTHVLPAVYFGMTICFNSSLKRIMKNLKLFKPGMTIVVPMFVDELYSGIWLNAKREGKEKKLKMAVALSRFCGFFGIDIRDRLFTDVFESFGGNLKYMVCGGAPLNFRAARGLYDMGIDIAHGYGITECAPLICVNLGRASFLGSVGRVVPGVEVKIDDPGALGLGEILVRGANVSPGYYKDDEANALSYKDGWFRTGDYGRFDWAKRLWIFGRQKNLIILDNGKNVFPEEIEALIADMLTYVRESVVFEGFFRVRGKKKSGIAVAVSVRPDTPEAALSDRELFEKVSEDIKRLNHRMTSYKRVTRLYVTREEFPKNASRKILRKNVVKVNTEAI